MLVLVPVYLMAVFAQDTLPVVYYVLGEDLIYVFILPLIELYVVGLVHVLRLVRVKPQVLQHQIRLLQSVVSLSCPSFDQLV